MLWIMWRDASKYYAKKTVLVISSSSRLLWVDSLSLLQMNSNLKIIKKIHTTKHGGTSQKWTILWEECGKCVQPQHKEIGVWKHRVHPKLGSKFIHKSFIWLFLVKKILGLLLMKSFFLTSSFHHSSSWKLMHKIT